MESSRSDESSPLPPPFFLPDESAAGEDVGVYPIRLASGQLVHGPHLPDESAAGEDVGVYPIRLASGQLIHGPPTTPAQPSFSLSPRHDCNGQADAHLPVSATPSYTPRSRFVCHETVLYRSPALTTCPSCQTQVTTQVTFQVGTCAWLMCLVFVLCGLVVGCCLIPFFVNHFKDAYHSCPHCRRVLHVQRKKCCE